MTEYEELSLALMGEILGQLKQLNAAAEVRKPHICQTERIEDYPNFDWEAFGAKVMERDEDGVCLVKFKGDIYSRRSPQNKFAPAIWFSKSDGKDEDGNQKYIKLIDFKKFDFKPEPIPARTKQCIPQPSRMVAPPPEPPAVVAENISREQAATIHKELKGAGIDSTAWMVEQGYKRLGVVKAQDYATVLAAAQASAKAAQDPAVLAAKSLAGAMSGEMVSA